jgi:8-oxo-dGTP pyrophosphatase MutT (NUDIX family)
VGLPGGRPKNSAETEKEAGIRELREETGLFARDLISYPQNTYTDFIKRENRQKSYIGKAYIAVDVQGRLNRYTKETKAFWARIDKLDRYKKRLSPTVKAVVYASLNALELE